MLVKGHRVQGTNYGRKHQMQQQVDGHGNLKSGAIKCRAGIQEQIAKRMPSRRQTCTSPLWSLPSGRSHYRHFRKIFNGILILKSLKMTKTKDLLVSGGVFWLPADSRVPSSADSGRLWSPLFPSAAEREKSSGIIFLLIRFVRSFHFNNSLLWLVL